MQLEPSTIRLVRESGAMLPVGAPGPVQAFYERLFELAPEVRPLFTGDAAAQAKKLADMLAWVLVHLDAPEVLVPTLRDLGARHAGYGVGIDDYAPVGSALIWMFQRTLGDRFTEDMEEAWLDMYSFISTEMERGARLRR
jgi:hemoglobin-like flavoprotein